MVFPVSNERVSFILCAISRSPLRIYMFSGWMFFELLNTFHTNKYFIIAGDLNTDIIKIPNCGVWDYLNLLVGYWLEQLINDYTMEEYLGNSITQSCIYHILVRRANLKLVSVVIRRKVTDYYFVSLTILGVNSGERNMLSTNEF